jgi:hypothetical protein
MTETSILPGAVPASDEGIDMAPPSQGGDETDGGSRRRLLILGAIAGIIVLAAAAYLLLHKSSSTTPTAASPVPTVVQSGAPPRVGGHAGHKAGKAGSKPVPLPKVAKHSTVRDPFQALVNPPVQTTGAPASTTTVSAPPTTAPTSGTTPVVVAPTPTPTTGTTPPPAPPASGSPLSIQLLRTHGQFATFKVVYSHHKFRLFNVQAPKPNSSTGTIFGKEFALIGIQDGDATVQIGDGTPFDLTKGVSHTA